MADHSQAIVVSVDPGRLSDVVASLRAAGMEVTESHARSGVVTGKAPESLLSDLELIEGVQAVEPSRDIQLPPPDSPVQ